VAFLIIRECGKIKGQIIKDMKKISLKTTLIFLASTAAILGIISYFMVFTGPQDVQPANNTSSTAGTPNFAFPNSAASSSLIEATGTVATSSATSTPTVFTSTSNAPFVTWSEGQPSFGITGGTLQNNQLTLTMSVLTGSIPQCVPINLRLVSDEQGDMQAPISPAAQNFPLGAGGDCEGTANTSYNQSVTFSVSGMSGPYLFTTGGTSNIYFEVSTTANGGLDIETPQQSG
jgi:hypothetical protein